MLTLVNSLLALWAVICAVYCWVMKRKNAERLEHMKVLDTRITGLKEEITAQLTELHTSAKNYEEAKDAFRAAAEKDAKTP